MGGREFLNSKRRLSKDGRRLCGAEIARRDGEEVIGAMARTLLGRRLPIQLAEGWSVWIVRSDCDGPQPELTKGTS